MCMRGKCVWRAVILTMRCVHCIRRPEFQWEKWKVNRVTAEQMLLTADKTDRNARWPYGVIAAGLKRNQTHTHT